MIHETLEFIALKVDLVFALELMIISALLHSVVSRSMEDPYFLAAIVVLRTMIACVLNEEIQELSAQKA